MIKAIFDVQDNVIKEFTLTGHADSGPYGSDIVCSAVSAVAIGTVNNLTRIADLDPLIDSDNQNGGFLKVTLSHEDLLKNELITQTLLKNLKLTLLDIEQNYPKFVEVQG